MPEDSDSTDGREPTPGNNSSPERARSFTDTSPLVELFSTKSRVEFTDALLRNPGIELTAMEIAELVGRHPSSFYRHEDVLKKFQILNEGREVGGTQLYTLNQSEVAHHLREAQASLVSQGLTVSDVGQSVNQDVEEQQREPQPPEPEENIGDFEEPALEIREELAEEPTA